MRSSHCIKFIVPGGVLKVPSTALNSMMKPLPLSSLLFMTVFCNSSPTLYTVVAVGCQSPLSLDKLPEL